MHPTGMHSCLMCTSLFSYAIFYLRGERFGTKDFELYEKRNFYVIKKTLLYILAVSMFLTELIAIVSRNISLLTWCI